MNFYLAKYASGIFRAPLTGESGNEGGVMRTIAEWEAHEMNKLFIVSDVPAWRVLRINITSISEQSDKGKMVKVIPHHVLVSVRKPKQA